MSRVFTLDEWLLHDLLGENGPGRQEEARALLEAILERCDRILLPPKSPWAKKAYALAGRGEPHLRKLARFLFHAFLQNLEKVLIPGDPEEEPDLTPIPEADRYLVRAALGGKAHLLVTTDEELRRALEEAGLIPVRGRGEFLEEYLGTEG
jgi:hypothetical protein